MRSLAAVRWLSVPFAAAGVLQAAVPSASIPRFGALYYPGETAVFEVGDAAFSRVVVTRPEGRIPMVDASKASAPVLWRVTDWLGEERASGALPADAAMLTIPHAALGGRFGAFRLALGTNETWFAFLPSREVAPCDWVGTGTHAGHGWWKGDFRYLDLVAAAGIGVVRDDAIWDWHEKRRGEIVFTENFRAMVQALMVRGILFNCVLNGKNDLYENPLDADAFARYAAAAATAARESGVGVRVFEIFNEPHNFHFPRVYLPEGMEYVRFQCDPKALWVRKHAELTRKAADAIRAVLPDANVGVGSEDYWDLFKRMLANAPIARKGDVVTIHPYDHFQPRPEGNWFFRDGGREVRETLLANGGADRIAITECGWTTYDATGGGTHAAVGSYPSSTLVEQAQYVVRLYLLARQHGIEFACQYDFMDDGPRRDYTEDNFGMVRKDATPKPAFAAVAAMTRLVGDAEPLGSRSDDEASYRRYAFRRADGATLEAVWAVQGETAIAWRGEHSERAAASGQQADNSKKAAAQEGVLPGAVPSGPIFLDLMGNEIPMPLDADGKLMLTERPIYILTETRR